VPGAHLRVEVADDERYLSDLVGPVLRRRCHRPVVGRVDLGGRHEVDGVTAARLDEAAEAVLRVQVVVLDVVADQGAHRHVDAELGESLLDDRRLFVGVEHDRDRGDALAARLQELPPQARALGRLEQFEVQVADHDLGAPQAVGDGLAAELRAVVHRLDVVEDTPARPPERLVVALHRAVQVIDDQ
jgi:hypothetical protein